MKLQETLLSTAVNDIVRKAAEEAGDEHVPGAKDTPMVESAFDTSDEEKMAKVEYHFGEIMKAMGLDLSDDSLKGTPYRVAKMYIKEVFSGLDPKNKPEIKLFENRYEYNEMLVEKNITLHSYCEHHFVPIIGKAHVAYISNGHVIGLSKINRIVRYFSKRPQVQERLTEQIADELKRVLRTDDVAILIDAHHMCVSTRGIEDVNSSTVTAHYSGKFQEESFKKEFLQHVKD